MTQMNFPTSVLRNAAEQAAVQERYARREASVVRKVRGLSADEHRQVLRARQLASRLAKFANHG